MYLLTITSVFLSTPSARRATGLGDKWFQDHQISIHALREEGDPALPVLLRCHTISIHALREEGDRTRRQMVSGSSNFYPRPPRGGRPGLGDKWFQDHQISIHALREEGDPALPVLLRCHTISIHALREEGDRTRRQMVSGSSNFYPRPPRGGRPLARLVRADGTLFLSTPSARRATRMHHG